MRRTAMLWEVFVTRFQEAFEQYEKHRLSSEEAGELLGMSGRNFRRLCVRYEEDGIEGLRDRRIGKVSPRRAPARELGRMHELYRERYRDFTVKHFHEQLVKRHDYKLCYTVTKASLQAAGLVAKAKRRGAHRKKRERRLLPGMLLFQDGSTHRWIGALGRWGAISTSSSPSTMPPPLFGAEGTMSSFLGLASNPVRPGARRLR
jgi:Helix-turn-helix domain